MDVEGGNGREAADGGRAASRESLFLGAEVDRGGVVIPVRVRNLSATGALIEADAGFVLGERLTLSFRRTAGIGASVIRLTARGAGLRFDSAIDPAIGRKDPPCARPEPNVWLETRRDPYRATGTGARPARPLFRKP